MAASVEIFPCPFELRSEALKLVLRELTPDQQIALVESLPPLPNRRSDPFDALIVAKRGRLLIAATWAQPQPGRVATLWSPHFKGAHEGAVARNLVKAATKAAKSLDLSMLQAILARGDSQAENSLLEAGFAHAADLIYLEWTPVEFSGNPAAQLTFETYEECAGDRLASLLSETYRGSLDCPVLDSIRSLEDTIEGYRATGDYDPNLWLIAKDHTQDVGLILLTKHAPARQIELIYMGVTPAARGRGFGAALLRHAQQIASALRSEKLLLAVDSANEPALNLYRAAGFEEWTRRSVYFFRFSRVG